MRKDKKTGGRGLRSLISALLSGISLFISCAPRAQMPEYWPTAGWKTSAPEALGMDSGMLLKALEKIAQLGLDLHSLLVIRHGYIVLEAYYHPNQMDTTHHLYSCTKSFVSTLVGLAIDKGYIKDVKQKIVDFLPAGLFTNADERIKNLSLENLLTMRSGLDWPELTYAYTDSRNPCEGLEESADWVKYILSKNIASQPGAIFNYNSGASHLLAVITASAVKQDLEQFAVENLFTPLGIGTYSWEKNPQGSPIGGWGLYLRPRDMAKLGYLFLRKGRWNEKQIVAADWVHAATTPRPERRIGGTNMNTGYGYQWWLQGDNMYSAQGYDGQLIVVVPEKDLVIVTTACMDSGSEVPAFFDNIIGNYIIPACRTDGALPANDAGLAELEQKIKDQTAGENK